MNKNVFFCKRKRPRADEAYSEKGAHGPLPIRCPMAHTHCR